MMIEQIREKAQDADLRAVLGQLLARREPLRNLQSQNTRKLMENRSRREGIPVEKIEQQAERAMKRHSLSAAESNDIDSLNHQRLAGPLTDEELFRWVCMIDDMEGYMWRSLLPGVYEESAPLIQELIDFYAENTRLLKACGERHGWKMPEPFMSGRRDRKKDRISKESSKGDVK